MTDPTGRSTAADPVMAASPTDEAAAKDNLLQLNPNDPAFQDIVGDWEDGKDYVFDRLVVHQVSPGNYTPMSAEGGKPVDESQEEESPEEDQGEEAETPPMSENPAVNKMLEQK